MNKRKKERKKEREKNAKSKSVNKRKSEREIKRRKERKMNKRRIGGDLNRRVQVIWPKARSKPILQLHDLLKR